MSLNANPNTAKSSATLYLIAFIAIGLIRALPLYIWFDDLEKDNDAYVALAEGWSASGTYGLLPEDPSKIDQVKPTAYRPPLYPLALSWLTRHDFSTANAEKPLGDVRLSLVAVAAFHWILGVATCVMTIRIASSLQSSLHLSVAAGLLVALDPILVRQSTLVMTETLATFLSTAFLAWWACTKEPKTGSYLIGGLLLGLSILCRPTAAVWLVFLFAWLLIAKMRQRTQLSWGNIAVMLLASVVTLSPWIMRNQIQFGKPIWATTHGGYTLVLANNPILYQHLAKGNLCRNWNEGEFHARWANFPKYNPEDEKFWNSPEATLTPTGRQLSEIESDQMANKAAIANMRRDPAMFLKSIVARVGWLWAFWPAKNQASRVQQIIIGMWYGATCLVLIVASLFAFIRRRNRERISWQRIMPGLLLAVALTAVHAIYWSNMRMRSVAMPVVYVCLVTAIAAGRGEVVRESRV